MSATHRFYIDPETKLQLTPFLKVIPYDRDRKEYMLIHTFHTKPTKENEVCRTRYTIVKFTLSEESVNCFNNYVNGLGERLPKSVLTFYDRELGKGRIRDELKDYFTVIGTSAFSYYKNNKAKHSQ